MADDVAPVIDPQVATLLNNWRQQELIKQLQGNQQETAVPKNMGEGIKALGDGLLGAIQNYKIRQQANTQQQIGTAYANAMGGGSLPSPSLGFTGMPAGTPYTPPASPPPSGPLSSNDSAGGTASLNTDQFLAGIRAGEGVPSATGHSSTGALGPYGLTAGFIKDWGSKLGLPTNKDAYEGNRELQDRLAGGAAQSMHDKYGSWADVAGTWLTGSPTGTSAPGNMSRQGYTKKVLNAAGLASNDSIGPSSYGVPAGQVAGENVVPSNLPPPIKTATASPPGFRDNLGPGTGGSITAAAPAPRPVVAAAPPEEDDTPPPMKPSTPLAPTMGPTPSEANPALSPAPMGDPQTFTPSVPPVPAAGGAVAAPVPPAGAASPPVVPPMTQVPRVGPPPPNGQGPAPPGTHWAQLPGPPLLLAGDLQAGMLGGGARPPQAGPPALAQGLGGNQPIIASGGPSGAPAPPAPPPGPISGPAPTPPAQPPVQTGGDARINSIQQEYNYYQSQIQKAQPYALAGPDTPWGQQANARIADAQNKMAELDREARSIMGEKPEMTEIPGEGKFLINPRTGGRIAQVGGVAPPQRPITDEEAAAAGIPDKAGYQKDPVTGKVEQITGTGKTDTTAIKEFEYGQAHPEFSRAPKWIPNASTNDLGQPVGGWVTPPNPSTKSGTAEPSPTAGLTDEQKVLVGTPNNNPMPAGSGPAPTLQLTDEQHAALDSIPAARRGMVQSILQRDMVAPPISARNPLPAMLRNDVIKVMPNFDFASQPGQVKAKSEFLAGGPSSYGKQIEFGSTAVNHLATYADASDDVDKAAGYSEGKLANIIGGPTAQEIGTKIAGRTTAGQGAINSLNATAMNFSGELTKYLTGAEGSQAEREQRAGALSADLTTYARKQAVLKQIDLIEGRGSQIQDAWHNAVGPNLQDFPVISPTTQKSLDKIRKWATTGPGAVQPEGVSPVPVTTEVPAAPQQKLKFNPATGRVE
jgi:hypothetical protein